MHSWVKLMGSHGSRKRVRASRAKRGNTAPVREPFTRQPDHVMGGGFHNLTQFLHEVNLKQELGNFDEEETGKSEGNAGKKRR